MEKCISESLLFQYLVNELDAEKNELIRQHLTQCPSCQKRIEIYSEDDELRMWHECHQRQQNDESSQYHPFSQDKLDKLFNSTISSIKESRSQSTKNALDSHTGASSEIYNRISIGKELNLYSIKTIGQYQIIKKIGQGGMGVVYLAIHSRLKKQVVLKMLLDKDWDNLDQTQRFYREMELVGQLDHPNIVKATDAGESDNTCFLVMEYLEGHDLKTILKLEGPLSITATSSVLRQVANGLQYIHNHDLIHRDIKPSNLFLTTDGQVKILDLGLAGLRHAGSSINDLTDTNCVMGSAYYMAPEQAQSIKTIDQRSDIYSLGCTFYQLLTGQVPFRKQTQIETIIAHREETAPLLSDHLPEIPEQLEELFQSMIKKNPDDRIQTMSEVVKILDDFLINKSEEPLNDSSDTYLTESQELKQICRNIVLTTPVEAQNHYSSTQYQHPQRVLNRKIIFLLSSTMILLSITLALGLHYFSRPVPHPVPPVTLSPLPKLSSSQALIEREAANLVLNHGCEIDVLFPNGEKFSSIKNVQSLPNQDFYVSKIAYVKPQTISHEILSQIDDLKYLAELNLNDSFIEDRALDAIKGLTSLRRLDLHETGITDNGLSHIGALNNLTHLSLQINQNITDEGLQILNQLQNLESVNLARTKTSDKGLEFIQNNPKINWLNISESQVSDQSVIHLNNLRQLKKLFLKETKISKKGIEEIRQSFGYKDPISFE
ncbi:MAG: protein kinase [Gimesia sp.]|nr:protein kinase [Gimesia sp.]